MTSSGMSDATSSGRLRTRAREGRKHSLQEMFIFPLIKGNYFVGWEPRFQNYSHGYIYNQFNILKLKFVWCNRLEDVTSCDMVSYKMFCGNRRGHTEGRGKREIVIIYFQRDIVNGWDKPSFSVQNKIHPNGCKMLTLPAGSVV